MLEVASTCSAVHAIATVYARLASASSKHCRLCAASAVQRWDRSICPCGAGSCLSSSTVHANAIVCAHLAASIADCARHLQSNAGTASYAHAMLESAGGSPTVHAGSERSRACDAGSCLSSSAVHANATVCACLASASSKLRILCAASAVQRWDRNICPCDAGVCQRQSNGACKMGTFSCQPHPTPSKGYCVLHCYPPQGVQQRPCDAASCQRQLSGACKCRRLCLCQSQPAVSNADTCCMNTSPQQLTCMRACLGANANQGTQCWCRCNSRTQSWCRVGLGLRNPRIRRTGGSCSASAGQCLTTCPFS